MTGTQALLSRLGIARTYLGERYMITAVEMVLEDEECLLYVTKQLYPKIAKQHQTTAACVEKNLRTAIKICWEHGNRRLLNEMAGYVLPKKPKTSEFIDLLASYIRRG